MSHTRDFDTTFNLVVHSSHFVCSFLVLSLFARYPAPLSTSRSGRPETYSSILNSEYPVTLIYVSCWQPTGTRGSRFMRCCANVLASQSHTLDVSKFLSLVTPRSHSATWTPWVRHVCNNGLVWKKMECQEERAPKCWDEQ